MLENILINLEKIGIGVLLFLCSYLANMGLGAWKSVKIEGFVFNYKLIIQSLIKFLILGISISLLTISVTILPLYSTYIGIEIDSSVMETIDSLVIIGAFLTATITYLNDAIKKLKEIFK